MSITLAQFEDAQTAPTARNTSGKRCVLVKPYNFELDLRTSLIPFPTSGDMTLEIALTEAKRAIDFFFNNDLEAARGIVQPW